jgi:hypothetical protein
MLGRRTETGGDEQGAELVAIQGDGVRLVIDARAADVSGRGMLKEFFFDGVPVEPGDGAQPPRDGSPGPAPGLQLPAKDSMSARRTVNRARERARHQVVNWRRSSAYASLVKPQYPARNPARASRSASVNAGWIMTRAVDGAVVVIGHLPAGLEPGGLGQLRVPAVERNLNVSRVGQSQHVTARPVTGR